MYRGQTSPNKSAGPMLVFATVPWNHSVLAWRSSHVSRYRGPCPSDNYHSCRQSFSRTCSNAARFTADAIL